MFASFRVHPGSQTYARCSADKADESIRLVAALEQGGGLPPHTSFDGFRASAHLYSACLHLRSARFELGGRRYAQALRVSLRSALGWRAVMRVARSMAAGVSRRLKSP